MLVVLIHFRLQLFSTGSQSDEKEQKKVKLQLQRRSKGGERHLKVTLDLENEAVKGWMEPLTPITGGCWICEGRTGGEWEEGVREADLSGGPYADNSGVSEGRHQW